MAYLDDIIRQVDETITRHVIVEMNTLLIALSDNEKLSREQRYQQQQRLRTAIAQKGHHHYHKEEEDETRREQLTKGGEIL